MVSISHHSSTSDLSEASQKFEDALENPASSRFSPEEEAKLLAESDAIKKDANSQFAHGDYSQAIGTYDRALASCPNYLDYEIAVLKSNIAACHVKLEDWKTAVESATQGLDALDRVEGKTKKDDKKPRNAGEGGKSGTKEDDAAAKKTDDGTGEADDNDEDQQVVELDSSDDEAAQLAKLQLSDERRAQVCKLRTKLLLRRAKGNAEQAGWSTLSAAEADYKELMQGDSLAKYLADRDRRFVRTQLTLLPGRVKEAQEREVGEMMGKLKELGNSFLSPFGLSTDNFKMVKDEKTGGYSMNFEGGGKK